MTDPNMLAQYLESNWRIYYICYEAVGLRSAILSTAWLLVCIIISSTSSFACIDIRILVFGYKYSTYHAEYWRTR